MNAHPLAERKILVSGAAGFIGSHLTEKLFSIGAHLKVFIHYNSLNSVGYLKEFLSQHKDKVEVIFGDVRDLDTVYHSLKGVEILFHLAAIISVPYSTIHPQEVTSTNINGTLNFLLASRGSSVKRIIHTSSSEVYGSALYTPIDEKHPRQPQSVYAASKVAADALCYSFFRSYETPVVMCRPFNTFGPRQSDRAVIPTIISQALRKKEISLGILSTRRDFTYVSDTVDGMIALSKTDAAIGQEINLGAGQDISIEELVYLISDLIGTHVKIKAQKERFRPTSSEVHQLLSNNQHMQALTGWKPTISLKEGLQKTIAWIEKNILLYDLNDYRL